MSDMRAEHSERTPEKYQEESTDEGKRGTSDCSNGRREAVENWNMLFFSRADLKEDSELRGGTRRGSCSRNRRTRKRPASRKAANRLGRKGVRRVREKRVSNARKKRSKKDETPLRQIDHQKAPYVAASNTTSDKEKENKNFKSSPGVGAESILTPDRSRRSRPQDTFLIGKKESSSSE